MDLKKYKDTLGKKINLKKNSYAVQNSSNSLNPNKIRVNKLNNSQQIKEKNRIQINIYKKPFKLTDGNNNNLQQNKIKNGYITKASNNNRTKDISLSSNSLYDTIDLGRNAINKISIKLNQKIKGAPKIKIKSKEKTPFKNKINTQENKENYQTNITSNKTKNIYKIYKTKTNNNFHKNINKSYINNKNNNYSFFRNNNLLKSTNTTEEIINNISLRLFKKETISSKNKLKKSILYTPKKRNELNNKNIYSKTGSKTIHQSAKKLSKYLLTSQNSESRFYSTKIFFPETNKIQSNKKKRGSLYTKVNYALNNIKNISSINAIKNSNISKNSNDNSNNNNEPSLINNNKNNKNLIHNYLYHEINSLISQEIIISESKGIISSKCPLGHITNYKFDEYFQNFRAIPDNNNILDTSLIFCFICKSSFNSLINFFCEKCYNFICTNCIFNHQKKFGHKIISIHSMNILCSFHNKKYNSFCYDCNMNSCELCHISNDKKNHNYKTFKEILSHYKKEEKSILNIQNEIRNQLKHLDDFMERYNEDLKNAEHYEILKTYFEEYINYFRNTLQLKEKFISKYNYNPNNYYNLMNVLNLTLPLFYDYNNEKLFKLSRINDIYDKYLIINDFINFVNNNSINIFHGNQSYKKFNMNLNTNKIKRTIKPSNILLLNNDTIDNIYENKYPKLILDLEYNGYFLLLKDHEFDIYDKDLNKIKNYDLINLFGSSYNEVIIGAKILENKTMAMFNYKKILIIKFSVDFLSYEKINEFDLKINGICNGFNNFGFDDETYEIQNPLVNNILDMNSNEIISFGIRLEDKYIGTIWQKNKRQESQILDINSKNNNSIYNIISVLKYNENKFAILEKNNENYFNVKIYTYETPYTPEKEDYPQSPSQEIEEVSNNSNINKDNKENIYDNIINKKEEKGKNNNINGNNYEKDENNLSDDSEENVDDILQEIKINAEKREKEYIQLEKKQKYIKIENEDIIIIKKKIFNEVFNLEKIKLKYNNNSKSHLLSLIKINEKIFAFLDNENIILVNFETCSEVSKINYGLNTTLIYLDQTPNGNLLFKEKNKIISYHINKNNLIRIYLPVFEYIDKRKKLMKWCLISGNENEDFINKAKIIDKSFMISLFEFRLEKWNLNKDYLN